MKISARNILKGAVVASPRALSTSVVSIKIGDDVVKADITMDAIKVARARASKVHHERGHRGALGLAQGAPAIAVVKSTDVMVGVE